MKDSLFPSSKADFKRIAKREYFQYLHPVTHKIRVYFKEDSIMFWLLLVDICLPYIFWLLLKLVIHKLFFIAT
ncbi:hypothetical protein PHSC3_000459 [Chlamydiales bacterium STE3]|nr:hypothetical protein PHSC3_000459 [Chlamydiales bacterium STE3]